MPHNRDVGTKSVVAVLNNFVAFVVVQTVTVVVDRCDREQWPRQISSTLTPAFFCTTILDYFIHISIRFLVHETIHPNSPYDYFRLYLAVARAWTRCSMAQRCWFPCCRPSNAYCGSGMYCLNGTTGVDNQNTNEAVNPLYQVSHRKASRRFLNMTAVPSFDSKTGGFTM
jgi:hypothetical protein